VINDAQIQEELENLRRLLWIEQEEEFKQYKEKFIQSSLSERRENGLTWFPIIVKGTEPGLGGVVTIELTRTPESQGQPHMFQPGKNAEIFSNNSLYEGRTISGIIKSLSRNSLKITLSTDEVPDWINQGRVGINLTFDENSYREMDLALRRIIGAENDRASELRDVLYGKRKGSFKKENENLNFPDLNDSQNEAVRKIDSAMDVAVVHGPPGTGKTTTLVKAILHTLKTETQILVCSPSNTAVDLMTEKLSAEGINVLRLGNPVRVSETLLKNTLDSRVASHPMYKDLKKYRKEAEEYRQMAGKFKRNFGKSERDQRARLYAEARSIKREAEALEDWLVDEQISKARVIACTPVVASGRLLRDKVFDSVFIDEAAQALEPACWIPILKARRVIFAGDHFQLPPTVKSAKAETGGLSATLFEKVINNQSEAAVMLRTQYRMNKSIMEFSNRMFYYNKLIAADTVKDRVLYPGSEDSVLNTPVEFLDTAGCGFDEQVNPETVSYYNKGEADLLIKHIELLHQKYYQECDNPVSIGVISPYREQVQLLTELIDENENIQPYRPLISVKTVDGFQGQERDVVYISLVRSNSGGEIGFLEDFRRLNVALTRAKKKLVIIGDSATISYNDFYMKMMDYFEEIESHKTAWEYIH
jgi:ATP-dependent RNA/DNA helicase IGHMBP2